MNAYYGQREKGTQHKMTRHVFFSTQQQLSAHQPKPIIIIITAPPIGIMRIRVTLRNDPFTLIHTGHFRPSPIPVLVGAGTWF